MGEVKLEWRDRTSGKWRVWEASTGGHSLTVWTRADGAGIDGPGDFGWRLGYDAFRQGTGATLAEAQLACEADALSKLREGVAALGGRVLDQGEVALVRDALWMEGGQCTSSHAGAVRSRGDAMRSLARELEKAVG